MDQQDVKKPFYRQTWYRTTVIVGTILVVTVIVLAQIFTGEPAKVSQEFIDKYHEIGSVMEEIIKSTEAVENTWAVFLEVSSDDYAENLRLTNQILTENENLISKLNTQKDKLAELKTLTGSIQDSAVREKALKLISVHEKIHEGLSRVVDYRKQFFVPASKYYGDLVAGKPTTKPDADWAAELVQKINSEEDKIMELVEEFGAARQEFADKANLQVK